MRSAETYIIIAIAALFIIAAMLLFAKPDKRGRLSPLAALAFAFIIAGIIFGEARWIGYSLIGTGVILAIADIVFKGRQGVQK